MAKLVKEDERTERANERNEDRATAAVAEALVTARFHRRFYPRARRPVDLHHVAD